MADTDIRFVDIPSGKTFTYDGAEHTGVESGDDYTRSGDVMKTNAGTYKVTVVLKDHKTTFWTDGTIGDKEIEWTILPKQVLIPPHGAKTYNGFNQIGVASHELYELRGTAEATDAGSYPVTGVLLDKDNTVWVSGFGQEGTTDDQDLSWEIKPADITRATAPGITYTGSDLQPEVSVSAGDLAATFDLGQWSPSPVRAVGTYTATVTGNGNFRGELAVTCEVLPKRVAVPVAKTGLVYDGSEKTGVPEGDGYTVTGNKGTNAKAYTATVSLTDQANTCWDDGSTGTKLIAWRISRRVVDIPKAHSWRYTGSELYGVYGCGVFFNCSGVNTATEPGDYTVRVSLQLGDYEWSDGTTGEKVIEWRIASNVVPVPTAERVTSYSSMEQVGVKEGKGYEFAAGSVHKATHAGDYVAVVVPKTGYLWPDLTKDPKEIPWSIKKAKPVVGRKLAWWGTYGVVVGEDTGWHSDGGLVLNPNRMTGLTLDVTTDWGSLKGTKLKVSESGDKPLTVTVTGDSRGGKAEDYEPLETTGNLTVIRLLFARPEAETGLVYTGKLLEGVHGDPSGEGYTVSGNTGTDAGDYTAAASLKDKDNFAWADPNGNEGSPDDVSVPWTISPAEITEAGAKSAEYTGEVITPEVTVLADGLDVTAHCDITDWSPSVLRDPGTYTGTAKPKAGDGNVTGSAQVTFTIDRAVPSGSPRLTVTYGDRLGGREGEIAGEMKAGGTVVAGTFEFYAQDAERVPHVSESGSAFNAVFTPDDADRYETVDVGVVVTVERRDLWVRAADDVISYGDDRPSFVIGSAIGLYGSDTLEVLHGTPTFSCEYEKGSDAGLYAIAIDVSAVTADDYTVRQDNNGTLTVNGIPITLRPKDVEKEYGDSYEFGSTDFDIVYGALVEGDSVDSVTLESDGAEASAPFKPLPYRITASDAVGTGLQNYDIKYLQGGLTVVQRKITITAKDKTKTYGDEALFDETADFQVTSGTLVDGDTIQRVTLESDGKAADALYRSDPYRIDPSDAVFSVADHAANYDITYAPGSLTVERRKITVRANDVSKECGTDAALSETGFSVTEGDLVNGDSIDMVTLSAPCAPASSSCTDCLITPSFAIGKGLGNYDITYDTGILTTGKCTPVKKSEFVLELAYGDTLAEGRPGTDWLMRCEGRENEVAGTFEPVNPGYKPKVSESGTEFDFRFYPFDTEKYNSADVTVKVIVSRKRVAVPEAIGNLRYDGTEKTGVVENDELYTLSGHKETDAGNYVATASLKDVENCCWEGTDDDIEPKQVDWEILKRQPILAGDGYAELTHGQRLLDAVIYGITADVGGVLSWVEPERQVLCAESGSAFAVRFTPSDTRNVASAITEAAVTVAKRAAVVTAVSCGKFHGDADPSLGAVVSGVLPGDTVTYSVTRAAGEDTGTYDITASGEAEQGCYSVTFTGGMFTISCRDGDVERASCLDSHAIWTESDCSCACEGSADACTASKGTWVQDGCYCDCSGTGRVQSDNHRTCECLNGPLSCTSAQTWVAADCACICAAVDGKDEKRQKEDCERDGIHRWDHKLCECKCIREIGCMGGEWSKTTCDCGPCADPGTCDCYWDQTQCGCISQEGGCEARDKRGLRVPGLVDDTCKCVPQCNVGDDCMTYDDIPGHMNEDCNCVACDSGMPCLILYGDITCGGVLAADCTCQEPQCGPGKSRKSPCSPCECDGIEAARRQCEVEGPNAADHWFNTDSCMCECRGSLRDACSYSGGWMPYYEADCECTGCTDGGKTQSKDKKTCECSSDTQQAAACESNPSSGSWQPHACSCDCSGQPKKRERNGVCVCTGDEDGALASACSKSGGKWDADKCECGCAAVSDKKKQSADRLTCVCNNATEHKACNAYQPEGSHTWSEDYCTCKCNDETSKDGCGTGDDSGVHYWDLGSCSCKCFAEFKRAACAGSGGEWDVEGYPCQCKCASGVVDDSGACTCGPDAADRKSRCELSNGTWVPELCDCDCGSDKTKQADGSCKCNDETGRAECEAEESGGRWNFYGHNCACDCDEVEGKHLDGGVCVCDNAEKEQPCGDSYGAWKKATCSCDCSDEEHGQRTEVGNVCVCVDETLRKNACEATDSGGTWVPELCECNCGGDFHREATEASGWKCACPDQKLADNCTYTNGSWDMMSCACTCGEGQTLQPDGTCKCDNEDSVRTKCESETSGGTFNAYGYPCACSCELAPGDKIEQDGECVCPDRPTRAETCESEDSGGRYVDTDCTCDCSGAEGKHAVGDAFCECDNYGTDAGPCVDPPSGGTFNKETCKCDCPEHKAEKDGKHECECDITDDFVFAEKQKCLDMSLLGTHVFNDETCECDCDMPDVRAAKTACQSAPSMGKWDSDPELPCTCDCSAMEYKVPSEDMMTCVCIDRDAQAAECAQGNPPGRWSDKYCVCCRATDDDQAGCYASDGDWDDEKCECDCTGSGKRQRADKMTCGCEADDAAEKELKDACEADVPGQPKRSWDPALCECGCNTEPGTQDARAKADCDEAIAQGVAAVWNKKTCTCDCVDDRRKLRKYVPTTSTEQYRWGCFCDKEEWEEEICGERYKDEIHQFSEADCDCPCGPLSRKRKQECEEAHKLDPNMTWFEDDCSCGCWNRDREKDCKTPKRWIGSQCRCGCAADEVKAADGCTSQSGGGRTYSWHQDKCACSCKGDGASKCWTHPSEHQGEDPGDGTIQKDCACKCDTTNYPCQVLDEKGYYSDGSRDEKDGKHGVLRDGAMDANCDCMCESVLDADGNRTAKGEPCWYMATDPVSGQQFLVEGKVWSDCSCVCKDAGKECQTETVAYGRVDPDTCECVCAPDDTPCEHLDGGQGVVRTNPDTGACECVCDYENEYPKCIEKAETENGVDPYTVWEWNDTACRCDCTTADLECVTDDGKAGFVNAKTCKCEPCNKLSGIECVEPTSLDEVTCRCDCSEYEEQHGTCLEEKGSMGYRRDPDQSCKCVCEWDDDTCATRSEAVSAIYGGGLSLVFVPGDCACRCNRAGEKCVDEVTGVHGHRDEETCQCVCRAEKEIERCIEKATSTGMPWVFDEELCECVCSDKEEDKCTTEGGKKVNRSAKCKCECDTKKSCNSPYGKWLETDNAGNLSCRCECEDRDKLPEGMLYGQKDWWEVDDTCNWDCVADPHAGECRDRYGANATASKEICDCKCADTACSGSTPDQKPLDEGCECFCDEAKRSASCPKDSHGDPMFDSDNCKCTSCTAKQKGDPSLHNPDCEEWQEKTCEWVKSSVFDSKKAIALANAKSDLERASYLYSSMSTTKGGLVGHVNPPDTCTAKGQEIYESNTGRKYTEDRKAADDRLGELEPTAKAQFSLLKEFATGAGSTYIKAVGDAVCPNIPAKPGFDSGTAQSAMKAWSELLDTFANLASYRTICQMKDCENVKDCSADMGWGRWVERDANNNRKCECECVSVDKALPRAKHRNWWTKDDNCKWTCDETKASVGPGQRLDTDTCEPVCSISCPPEGDPSKPHVMDRGTYCECGCNLNESKCRELNMTFNVKACKCEGLSAKEKWEQEKQAALRDIASKRDKMKADTAKFTGPKSQPNSKLPGFAPVEDNCSPVGMKSYCLAFYPDAEDYCDEFGSAVYREHRAIVERLVGRPDDWELAKKVAKLMVGYRDCLYKLHTKIDQLVWDEHNPPDIPADECEEFAPDESDKHYVTEYLDAKDQIDSHVAKASNCNVYA